MWEHGLVCGLAGGAGSLGMWRDAGMCWCWAPRSLSGLAVVSQPNARGRDAAPCSHWDFGGQFLSGGWKGNGHKGTPPLRQGGRCSCAGGQAAPSAAGMLACPACGRPGAYGKDLGVISRAAPRLC